MQPTETQAEKSRALGWLHFPKTHFVATSALTVGLITLLSVWPSENAEAIRPQSLADNSEIPSPHQPDADAKISSDFTRQNDQPTAALVEKVLEVSAIELPANTDDQQTAIVKQTNTEQTSIAAPEQAPQTELEAQQNWAEQTVKSGDNLSNIFKRVKLFVKRRNPKTSIKLGSKNSVGCHQVAQVKRVNRRSAEFIATRKTQSAF